MRAVVMIVLACALLVLALLLVIPVGVNLPDSWFGVVLIALLIGGASVLIYKAVQSIRRSKQSNGPGSNKV